MLLMTLTVTRRAGWVFCRLLLYGNSSDAWLPFKYLLERPVCWLGLRYLRVLASAGCASYLVRMHGGSWGFLGAVWGAMVIAEIGWGAPDIPHCCVASLMLPGLAWGEQTWQMKAGEAGESAKVLS